MIRVLFFILSLSVLEAEVLEVKQLFNKKIVQVKRVTTSLEKSFYATTKFDEKRVVDVRLRFGGFVEKLYANEGFMFVKKGESLFRIYSQTLSEIKAEIDLAKASRQKIIVRNLEKKLRLLNAGKEISKAYTVDIKAPISGIVLEKHINEGGFIKKGTLVYKLVDMSTMWVVFQAYQKDIASLKKGMLASIMIEGVGRRQAKVDFIYPFINPKTKTVDVRVVLENPDFAILPNMFAKVTLKATPTSRLVLPKSAVLTKGAKHYLFKPVGESEFEPIEVKAKRIDSQHYEIKSGVKEGDKVIDKALFMLDSDAITNGLYESDEDEEW